ncbi:MAG: imidazoleglycerol-phosphate dehydratase HisB [Deltaproteobacteria bacterium]|nr:imidazoleglycerol-phosphate dehydratase HisB [Deltaproteobacteria bacterium]
MTKAKRRGNGHTAPQDEPKLPVRIQRPDDDPAPQVPRRGVVHRITQETDVKVAIEVDGTGKHKIDTGIPFLNHMLVTLAHHSLMDIQVLARGDVEVDPHHTVEDIGLCLGRALLDALGDRQGIHRFGECARPFDEALVRCHIDFSGRPQFVYRVALAPGRIGSFDVELAEVFFSAFAAEARMNLHLVLEYGQNRHHIVEGCFKTLAAAIRRAVEVDPRRGQDVASTKGRLD